MPATVDYLEKLAVAKKLIQYGARPVTASNLTGLPRSKTIQLYKDIHHRPPPKGMLPFASEWFIFIEERRMQAAILIDAYLRFAATQETKNNGLILWYAYQNYIATCPEPRISIDRAWILCRLVASNILEYHRCQCCRCRYLKHDSEVQYHCPACDSKESMRIPFID